MSLLDAIGSTPVIRAIGITLVHSVWQGLIIGLILACILRSMRQRSPNERYVVCLAGLVMMLTAPITTLFLVLKGVPLAWGGAGISSHRFHGGFLPLDRVSPALPWLTSLWFVGAFSFHIRLIVKLSCAERIRRSGLVPASERWRQHLDKLRDRMGIDRAVRVMESTLVSVPSVIGWLKPIVLVPVGIADRLTPLQIQAILAHELAHIRRHDYFVNLVQSVFEALLFFHPVTWWLSDRLRTEREFCCDDVAIVVTDDALHYARALATLEELRDQVVETSVASTGGSLMKRLARIFDSKSTQSAGAVRWLAPLIGLISVIAIAVLIGAGCGNDSVNDAVAGSPVVGPEAQVQQADNATTAEMRETITVRLRQAVADGVLTDEQATCVISAIEGDGDGLIFECIDQGCTIATAPGCCPDGVPPPDCCEGVDVKVLEFEAQDGGFGELRLAVIEGE